MKHIARTTRVTFVRRANPMYGRSHAAVLHGVARFLNGNVNRRVGRQGGSRAVAHRIKFLVRRLRHGTFPHGDVMIRLRLIPMTRPNVSETTKAFRYPLIFPVISGHYLFYTTSYYGL